MNIATGGPNGAGDNFLKLENGSIGKFAMRNTGTSFSGTISPSVPAITVDMMRPDSDTGNASIRLVLFGPGAMHNADRWTSTNPVTVPPDGVWTNYSFSILQSDLTHVLDQGGTFAELTSDLDRIMFRHDPGLPSSAGTSLSGSVGFDNTIATPAALGVERPFANYGVLSIIDQPQPGQISWSGDYSDQAWEWSPSEAAPLPGWDMNAMQFADMQFTSGLSIDEDFMATASFVTTTTVTARENGVVAGTLVLSEVAEQGLLDLNASRATVDNETGTILLRSGSLLDGGRPITDVTLIEATGIFSGIEQVGPWEGYYSGYYVKPLWAELDLQQNILEAPFVGGFFETALIGWYAPVPEPSAGLLLASGLLLGGVFILAGIYRRSRSESIAARSPSLRSQRFGAGNLLDTRG